MNYWTYQRNLKEFTTQSEPADMSESNLFNTFTNMQSCFAPHLETSNEALVTDVIEATSRIRGFGENTLIPGNFHITPPEGKGITHEILSTILDAWCTFWSSKAHHHMGIEQGLPAFTPALRMSHGPTNYPHSQLQGVIMQFCGNWIDTTDYMGLHEDLWHIYKCLREAYVLPESLTESINSSWDLKAHIGLQHLHTNRKIRNEGIEVLGIAVSDTTASQAIADAFFQAFISPNDPTKLRPIEVFGGLPISIAKLPTNLDIRKSFLQGITDTAAELHHNSWITSGIEINPLLLSNSYYHLQATRTISNLNGIIINYRHGLSKPTATLICDKKGTVMLRDRSSWATTLYNQLPYSKPPHFVTQDMPPPPIPQQTMQEPHHQNQYKNHIIKISTHDPPSSSIASTHKPPQTECQQPGTP